MCKEFLFGVMKLFWNWIVVMTVSLLKYTKTTEFYTLKGCILSSVNSITIKNGTKLFLLGDHSDFWYGTQKELIELYDSVIIKLFNSHLLIYMIKISKFDKKQQNSVKQLSFNKK